MELAPHVVTASVDDRRRGVGANTVRRLTDRPIGGVAPIIHTAKESLEGGQVRQGVVFVDLRDVDEGAVSEPPGRVRESRRCAVAQLGEDVLDQSLVLIGLVVTGAPNESRWHSCPALFRRGFQAVGVVIKRVGHVGDGLGDETG